MFDSDKLNFALNLRGVSKTSLAKQLNVSSKIITNYLKGKEKPNTTILTNIVEILNLPEKFFNTTNNFPSIDIHDTSLVCHNDLPIEYVKTTLSHCSLGLALNDWVMKYYGCVQNTLPDLSGYTPDEAAKHLRLVWGIDTYPIPHTMQLMEIAGIRIYSTYINGGIGHPLSLHYNDDAFIFINNGKHRHEVRFDIICELAFLVCKFPTLEERKEFAMSFLLSETFLTKCIQEPITEDLILSLAVFNAVSINLLLERIWKLKLISESLYKKYLTSANLMKRYTDSDIVNPYHERSEVWGQLLILFEEDNKSIEKIANDFNVNEEDIWKLMYKLTNHSKTQLRLVN
jgi:Zn-dependent peptidase ImmA (M78 family)/transcriptional regulator with XRE-family HTH domain